MQPPTDLYEPGKSAYAHACATLRTLDEDPERSADAIVRYARAVDTASWLWEAWSAEGRPQYATDNHGALCVHPLVKGVRDAEVHAGNMAKVLGLTPDSRFNFGRRPGRPKGSSQAPDRKVAPIRKAA